MPPPCATAQGTTASHPALLDGEHPELSVLCSGPTAHQGTPPRNHLPSQGGCSRMASPTLHFPGGISAGVQLLTPSAATTCKVDQSGSETSAPCTSFVCHTHGSQADLCNFFLPNKPVGILNRAKETGDEAQGQLKASLKTKKPSVYSKTSNPAAKLSADPIR